MRYIIHKINEYTDDKNYKYAGWCTDPEYLNDMVVRVNSGIQPTKKTKYVLISETTAIFPITTLYAGITDIDNQHQFKYHRALCKSAEIIGLNEKLVF